MSEWLVPTIMGIQGIALALISRLRWRCYQQEDGTCRMVSGCTEHALIDNGGVDCNEYVLNDQKVLVLSTKIH